VNWTWSIRSGDGGMNGLEFTLALTAGDLSTVLVHAAPRHMQVEVRAGDRLVASGDAERQGEYSPMTLLQLTGDGITRGEVWPDESHLGLPVLLAGGEVGVLLRWTHAPDRSWWQWAVEFSNHKGRPPDWSPPDSPLRSWSPPTCP